MYFSQFITNHAWEAYVEYCAIRGILPVNDTDIPSEEKVCALLDKTFKLNTNGNSNPTIS